MLKLKGLVRKFNPYNQTDLKTNTLNELLSCEYDLNGNPLLRQNDRLIYDPLDQLIEVESDTQKIKFTYDTLGRRLSKYLKLLNLNKLGDASGYKDEMLAQPKTKFGIYLGAFRKI